MNASSELPLIRAALGDTLLEVQQQSNYTFHFDHLTDNDLVGVDQPVKFDFAGPGLFDVPPTRFLALDCVATIVVSIETSPHLKYLSAQEALALADEMERRIALSGWFQQSINYHVTGREELMLRLRDPAEPDDMKWYLAAFENGNARLILELRRTHRKGRMADYDLFLLNLRWRDDVLAKRADALASNFRQLDSAPQDGARSIRLESYAARVRRYLPRQ